MSDFDKEAERQRLREKYEAEREDREATEHMSELLLKGATMTNAHCGTCGDPIFRYDGQEFCPTCSNKVQDDATTTADANTNQQDDATTTADTHTGDAQPQEANVQPQDANVQPQEANVQPRDATRTDADPTAATAASSSATPEPEPPAADDRAQRHDTVSGTGDALAGENAVANVEATVERFAAAAADTDDPERAREYLAVVRDATDTLRTLRGDAR
ncbi:Sjogren's syndrome/scleroderma autoantigen 1 family protein [Halorubellus salinus]|uniref:Sjogren's syndrome/scleroderma autoantigen 1 family protein n=1 Tax=Halorubellus salinus TaxID=755309 RepID=UPI001D0634E9|nr:Sjogren's syndrome/scleroderma autoantigen 1 family protein [Halorubellus salinus]